jgi:hypothetical protein
MLLWDNNRDINEASKISGFAYHMRKSVVSRKERCYRATYRQKRVTSGYSDVTLFAGVVRFICAAQPKTSHQWLVSHKT